MEVNKHQLETLISYPVTYLSYPYGLYNEDTLSVSEELKVEMAFTTKERIVTAQSPLLKLGRYQVLNMKGASFKKRIDSLFK